MEHNYVKFKNKIKLKKKKKTSGGHITKEQDRNEKNKK